MSVRIITGDVRDVLPTLAPDSFDCCVTSPPYFGLRDYGVEGQIGLEPTLDAYLAEMVSVCREVRRVLKPSGTFWLNIGDSYAMSTKGSSGKGTKQVSNAGTLLSDRSWRIPVGLKPKDLCMVPARLALALQADGWWLRSEIIWSKPNPMPESVTDRPTSAHEKIWMLAKSERYFFDAAAVREDSIGDGSLGTGVGWGNLDKQSPVVKNRGRGRIRGVPPRHSSYTSSDQSGLDVVGRGTGRNVRNVWTMATQPFSEAHFATFPPELAERCIKAGCPVGGRVLDPFGGAGTTGLVADRLQRDATLIELNPTYATMARQRIDKDAPLFADSAS